ncbi:MAG: methyltransferase domain-containing protein, partial [Rhodospirillales bacterium]|nr:methyltransferase domain-containing protein [Rhodospirillales bacterium]
LYYSIGTTIIAPTFPFSYHRAIRRHIDPSGKIVVDIGSGNTRAHDDIICVDLFGYDEVDIVCDLGKLPFKPNSVDGFTSQSVLEHVPKLPALADRLCQCTRPGGVGLHLIPFLYPYHASPGDFTRLTHTGAAGLFPGWDVVEQTNVTGPVTYFLLGIIEFLAAILSLGSSRVRGPLYLALCLLTFPVKFLDAPFIGRKAFLSMAPTILTVVRKQ